MSEHHAHVHQDRDDSRPRLVRRRTRFGAGAFVPAESSNGLILHNVSAEPVTLEGKKGLRLTLSKQTRDELSRLTPQEQAQRPVEQFATIKDLEFSNGVIEPAGAPAPDADAGARGFVGIAFRLQPDNATYDAFYLRPTNGRADDQERRNHSTQHFASTVDVVPPSQGNPVEATSRMWISH